MSWSTISKESSKWHKKRFAVKVTRGKIGALSRGEIAEAIHDDVGATVTRKDIEDYYGVKKENNWTEIDKE